MQNNRENRVLAWLTPETRHVTASCGMFLAFKKTSKCLKPFISLFMKCLNFSVLCGTGITKCLALFSYMTLFYLSRCHGITFSVIDEGSNAFSTETSVVVRMLHFLPCVEFASAEETGLFLD